MKQTLEECARVAGEILRRHFGGALSWREKENPSSIVTEADLASERAILEILDHRFPGDSILAEESGHRPGKSGITWVIDPLDGTSNFAAGLPWFGVLLAVLKDAEPILGALYLPLEDRLYLAESGQGTWRNGERLHLSEASSLRRELCAYGMDACADEHQLQRQALMMARLLNRVRNLRATNSLVDAAFTLDGCLGGFINHHCKIWDIAATKLLFREAGGILADFAGREIQFDLGADACQRSYQVIGSSRHLLPQILDALG